MKFWMPLMLEPLDQFLPLARTAEACGFEGVALADHVAIPVDFRSVHPSGENPFSPDSPFPDPLTTATALAGATTTLKFLTYVYILPLREPFSVAKQVATAAALSGYRLVFGIGVGWLEEELALFGADWTTRGQRTDEMLAVIRDFWDDGSAEHHGRFFDFGPTAMHPVPEAPIPIWVGGKSRAAMRRAAGQDGWAGMNYDPDEARQLLDELARVRAETGTADKPFDVVLTLNAAPTVDLYRELEERGVTATIGLPWPVGDPAFASLAAKQAAIEAFAERIVQPCR